MATDRGTPRRGGERYSKLTNGFQSPETYSAHRRSSDGFNVRGDLHREDTLGAAGPLQPDEIAIYGVLVDPRDHREMAIADLTGDDSLESPSAIESDKSESSSSAGTSSMTPSSLGAAQTASSQPGSTTAQIQAEVDETRRRFERAGCSSYEAQCRWLRRS